MLTKATENEYALVKQLQIEMLYLCGMPLDKCCKKAGISVHTYYKWTREGSCFTALEQKCSEV